MSRAAHCGVCKIVDYRVLRTQEQRSRPRLQHQRHDQGIQLEAPAVDGAEGRCCPVDCPDVVYVLSQFTGLDFDGKDGLDPFPRR